MIFLQELTLILMAALQGLLQSVWLQILLYSLLGYIVFHAMRMLIILLINKRLSTQSKKWTDEETKDKKILVLGDSTAVGTGATRPEDTIAGKLSHDFPNHQIVNMAVNGSLIRDLPKQIGTVLTETFDFVIISSGGNDVWHLTRKGTIQKHLTDTLQKANLISKSNVFYLVYNNIGDAPLFPSLLRNFLRKRCAKIQNLIEYTCLKHGVEIIELFNQTKNNPFLDRTQNLFAPDGIHPSSEGYAAWYKRMWRIMVEKGFRSSHLQ